MCTFFLVVAVSKTKLSFRLRNKFNILKYIEFIGLKNKFKKNINRLTYFLLVIVKIKIITKDATKFVTDCCILIFKKKIILKFIIYILVIKID